MRLIPAGATDDAILAAVADWVGLLATGNLDAAAISLYQDQHAHRLSTSAAGLRTWLASHLGPPGPPGTGVWVSAPATVRPTPLPSNREPLAVVYRAEAGMPVGVDYALPVQGQWSDLVAYFDLVAYHGGYGLRLRDLAVA